MTKINKTITLLTITIALITIPIIILPKYLTPTPQTTNIQNLIDNDTNKDILLYHLTTYKTKNQIKDLFGDPHHIEPDTLYGDDYEVWSYTNNNITLRLAFHATKNNGSRVRHITLTDNDHHYHELTPTGRLP